MRQVSIALFVPLVLVLVGLPLAMPGGHPGPQTLAEVITVAEQNGLYCATSPRDDPNPKCLIVSTSELDEDVAALVNLSSPRDGTASCYVAWGSANVHYDPAHCAYWGGMFVHGDPAVVRALTGAKLRER
jgi:hypothetical protein